MTGSSSRLGALTKALSSQWEQTKDSWRDAKAREFERKYIEEVVTNVDRAVAVIDQLDKLLTKIRTDCE